MMILAQEKQERITHINTIGWNYLQIGILVLMQLCFHELHICLGGIQVKEKTHENAGNLISTGVFIWDWFRPQKNVLNALDKFR